MSEALMKDTTEQVLNILQNFTGKFVRVKFSDELTGELNMDSLDQLEVVMDCEELFGINITDAEASETKTVQQLIDLCYDLRLEKQKDL
jgi:acyl carrier protein